MATLARYWLLISHACSWLVAIHISVLTRSFSISVLKNVIKYCDQSVDSSDACPCLNFYYILPTVKKRPWCDFRYHKICFHHRIVWKLISSQKFCTTTQFYSWKLFILVGRENNLYFKNVTILFETRGRHWASNGNAGVACFRRTPVALAWIVCGCMRHGKFELPQMELWNCYFCVVGLHFPCMYYTFATPV